MIDEERRGYEKLISDGWILVENNRILIRRGWYLEVFGDDDRNMIEALAGLVQKIINKQ
jgi:hypothetical protein